MWGNNQSASLGLIPGRQTLGPLLIMTVCPLFVNVIWYNLTQQDGSLTALIDLFLSKGIYVFPHIWPGMDEIASQWKLLGSFALLQLVFMKVLPGARFEGPLTPAGHTPVYKANGVPAFLCTIAVYILVSMAGVYQPGTAFKNLGAIYCFLNIFSFPFCLMLYIKGLYFPSGPDNGSSGNFAMDYYWGTELYPRVFGWDIKTFTNCRWGLMGWAILLIDYAGYQYFKYQEVSDSMLVCVGLQLVYIFKFFWWETGYWRSLDIMHDRGGFMLCWGCLVWVPSVYTQAGMYLAAQPPLHLGTPLALFFFASGVFMIWLNYDSDRQRYDFRQKRGKVDIWGKKAQYITAHYKTDKGETKESLLLCSGYWSLSRHFHYVPEVLAALFWAVPAHSVMMPYFYVIFLCILLTDRAVRDDYRCKAKYGANWDKYCQRVPYRIIPYIF